MLLKGIFILLIFGGITILLLFKILHTNHRAECPFNSFPTSRNRLELAKIPKIHPFTLNGLSQKIPFTIFQTNNSDLMPIKMKNGTQNMIDLNPEYNYKLYTDEDAREYIEANYPPDILQCYDDLIPGAFKADLFRYLILFKEGGVYIDMGHIHVLPLRDILLPKDEFVSFKDSYCDNCVYNAIICVIPGHPILEKAIELSVKRIKTRNYGKDCLDITGPSILGKAFISITGKEPLEGIYPNNIRLGIYDRFHHCESGTTFINGKLFSYTKYPGYRSDMKWYRGDNHYGKLYEEKNVYKKKKMEIVHDIYTLVCGAIIIEPRKHPAMRFVIKHALERLPENWPIIIYHGTRNKKWLYSVLEDLITPRIKFKSIGVDNLSIKDYNNLCLSSDLWKSIPFEKILVFQTDSIILSKNKNRIYDYIQYPYIGAPFIHYLRAGVPMGNGGFSLRDKNFCLKAVKYWNKNPTYENEDLVFSKYLYKNYENTPPIDVSKSFSVESIYFPDPYGTHKAWFGLKPEYWSLLKNRFPELSKLEELNRQGKVSFQKIITHSLSNWRQALGIF